ncbi:MAG: terpene cyclase/mutase family protein [Candidatus Lokiarchaeota archaeon]|nr:terpene cyclase/mutase family protein [Candidatus Lokiarchaeota archaeon]
MEIWKEQFKHDPLTPLISSKNEAITYFTKRDLLEETVEAIEMLWDLPSAIKIIKKQQEDGSWRYPAWKTKLNEPENYNLLETYRQLGFLVEKYGFSNEHETIKKAAEYIFSCQTDEGDIRGFYGTQYSPNYAAAITELLIKAGYENNPRVESVLKWLLSMRQEDGGWAIAMRTNNAKYLDVVNNPISFEPDKKKPFSHMVTGIVLRAFAAHSQYRKNESVKIAGELLTSRFFKSDKYSDRRVVDYWTKVSFPFWWTDIVSSLDSLSLLGFTKSHQQIKLALEILIDKQSESGMWDLKLLKTKDKNLSLWINLAICRIFSRFYI